MANIRTFYACQALMARGPSGADGGSVAGQTIINTWEPLSAISTLGMTTNYNLEPVYQLGQLAPGTIYENNPEVEISVTQTLTDRDQLIEYLMGTGTLTSLSDSRGGLRLLMYPQTVRSGDGQLLADITIEPAYLQNITFNFPTDGAFTADYTIVGDSKVIARNPGTQDAAPEPNITGVFRRNSFESPGWSITNMNGSGGALPTGSLIQNITVSVDLGRDEIYQLGDHLPYTRYINFPVEVSTEIEVIAASGDHAAIDISAEKCSPTSVNIKPQPIEITWCGNRALDLGSSNYLQSVSQAGGDAGGDNVTYTYSYVNYSDFGFSSERPSYVDLIQGVDDMEEVDFSKYDTFEKKK